MRGGLHQRGGGGGRENQNIYIKKKERKKERAGAENGEKVFVLDCTGEH